MISVDSSHLPHYSDSSPCPLVTFCLRAPYVNTLILQHTVPVRCLKGDLSPLSLSLSVSEGSGWEPFLWSVSAATHLTPWKVWQLHSHAASPHHFHTSTWSQAVITQLHAPGPSAADWSLSDGWQEKLSEGIKYSHTAVRRSRGESLKALARAHKRLHWQCFTNVELPWQILFFFLRLTPPKVSVWTKQGDADMP